MQKFCHATCLNRPNELRGIAQNVSQKHTLIHFFFTGTPLCTFFSSMAKSKNTENHHFLAFFGTRSLNKKVSKFYCENFAMRHASIGQTIAEISPKTCLKSTPLCTFFSSMAKSKNAENRRFSAFFGTRSLNKKVSKFYCKNFAVRHASIGQTIAEISTKTCLKSTPLCTFF